MKKLITIIVLCYSHILQTCAQQFLTPFCANYQGSQNGTQVYQGAIETIIIPLNNLMYGLNLTFSATPKQDTLNLNLVNANYPLFVGQVEVDNIISSSIYQNGISEVSIITLTRNLTGYNIYYNLLEKPMSAYNISPDYLIGSIEDLIPDCMEICLLSQYKAIISCAHFSDEAQLNETQIYFLDFSSFPATINSFIFDNWPQTYTNISIQMIQPFSLLSNDSSYFCNFAVLAPYSELLVQDNYNQIDFYTVFQNDTIVYSNSIDYLLINNITEKASVCFQIIDFQVHQTYLFVLCQNNFIQFRLNDPLNFTNIEFINIMTIYGKTKFTTYSNTVMMSIAFISLLQIDIYTIDYLKISLLNSNYTQIETPFDLSKSRDIFLTDSYLAIMMKNYVIVYNRIAPFASQFFLLGNGNLSSEAYFFGLLPNNYGFLITSTFTSTYFLQPYSLQIKDVSNNSKIRVMAESNFLASTPMICYHDIYVEFLQDNPFKWVAYTYNWQESATQYILSGSNQIISLNSYFGGWNLSYTAEKVYGQYGDNNLTIYQPTSTFSNIQETFNNTSKSPIVFMYSFAIENDTFLLLTQRLDYTVQLQICHSQQISNLNSFVVAEYNMNCRFDPLSQVVLDFYIDTISTLSKSFSQQSIYLLAVPQYSNYIYITEMFQSETIFNTSINGYILDISTTGSYMIIVGSDNSISFYHFYSPTDIRLVGSINTSSVEGWNIVIANWNPQSVFFNMLTPNYLFVNCPTSIFMLSFNSIQYQVYFMQEIPLMSNISQPFVWSRAVGVYGSYLMIIETNITAFRLNVTELLISNPFNYTILRNFSIPTSVYISSFPLESAKSLGSNLMHLIINDGTNRKQFVLISLRLGTTLLNSIYYTNPVFYSDDSLMAVCGTVYDQLIIWDSKSFSFQTFILPHYPAIAINSVEFNEPNESLDPFVYKLFAISSFTNWTTTIVINIGIMNSQRHIIARNSSNYPNLLATSDAIQSYVINPRDWVYGSVTNFSVYNESGIQFGFMLSQMVTPYIVPNINDLNLEMISDMITMVDYTMLFALSFNGTIVYYHLTEPFINGTIPFTNYLPILTVCNDLTVYVNITIDNQTNLTLIAMCYEVQTQSWFMEYAVVEFNSSSGQINFYTNIFELPELYYFERAAILDTNNVLITDSPRYALEIYKGSVKHYYLNESSSKAVLINIFSSEDCFTNYPSFNVIDSALGVTENHLFFYLFLLNGYSQNMLIIPLWKGNNFLCPVNQAQIQLVNLLDFFQESINNNLPTYSNFNTIFIYSKIFSSSLLNEPNITNTTQYTILVNVDLYALIQFNLALQITSENSDFENYYDFYFSSVNMGIVTGVYSNFGTSTLLNQQIDFFQDSDYFLIQYLYIPASNTPNQYITAIYQMVNVEPNTSTINFESLYNPLSAILPPVIQPQGDNLYPLATWFLDVNSNQIPSILYYDLTVSNLTLFSFVPNLTLYSQYKVNSSTNITILAQNNFQYSSFINQPIIFIPTVIPPNPNIVQEKYIWLWILLLLIILVMILVVLVIIVKKKNIERKTKEYQRKKKLMT